MRIAFTGTSSTGKTTIANRLMNMPEFRHVIPRFVTVDGRAILDRMGFRSMDRMRRDELRLFQEIYFETKIKTEHGLDSFLTDRSFVDVASYWFCRDTFDLPADEQMRLIVPCREAAKRYDVHFYFPFGQIRFEEDGYRSIDVQLHSKIDHQILYYLREWQLFYVTIDSPALESRERLILDHIHGFIK